MCIAVYWFINGQIYSKNVKSLSINWTIGIERMLFEQIKEVKKIAKFWVIFCFVDEFLLKMQFAYIEQASNITIK